MAQPLSSLREEILARLFPPRPSRNADLITSRLSNTMVTINVSNGNETKSYLLHKDVICRMSPVFSAALEGSGGEWKETQEQKMDWPECDPETFDVFVHWLYTQRLPSNAKLPGNAMPSIFIVRLFVLGDRAMIPTLKSKCYARLRSNHDTVHKSPASDLVAEIYKQCLGESQLGRYVTKIIAYKTICNLSGSLEASVGKEVVARILDATPEFAVDVAKELNRALFDIGLEGTKDSGHLPGQKTYILAPIHPYNDPTFDTFIEAPGIEQKTSVDWRLRRQT